MISNYTSNHEVVATICSKEVVPVSNDSDGNGHQYRVYTSAGTFRMEDTIVNGVRFNTADAYGRLQSGVTYRIEYYGWRIGLSSDFPNITKAVKVPEAEQQPHACD